MQYSGFSKRNINFQSLISLLKNKRAIIIIVLLLVPILFYNIYPRKLFDTRCSAVLKDRNGVLLGAHIAPDGQWRFAQTDSVCNKFKTCIITYEDKRFFYHPGIDPLAIARAIYSCLKTGHVVSGASTLTMQTVRMSRRKPRTFCQKIIESILAVQTEMHYSKEEILQIYAEHAPFGGNTVGLETASQRYFGHKSSQLTWAEAALLAVLPNNPSLVNPGKNRVTLLNKRNKLLNKLYIDKEIDKETLDAALDEPIPDKPVPYPQSAPHLLQTAITEGHTQINSTIDITLQNKIEDILQHHIKEELAPIGVFNGAVIVADVETGEILAYVGNSRPESGYDTDNSYQVDITRASRSTGSILKPFLYAAALSEGSILPHSLIPDIPTQISGYMPQNYRLTYDGAVPADKALAQSLNVPAVRMLANYGNDKFINILKYIGLTTINQPADYYGLSLILGGCEANLYELCGAYASLQRHLNFYCKNGVYNKNCIHPLRYIKQPEPKPELSKESKITAAGIYFTLSALTQVERPENESGYQMFESFDNTAWKTGTSFGFRDAWAIGMNTKYIVGVWIGNADGEGRPGLVGVQAAAPVLFDIFKLFKKSTKDFQVPNEDIVYENICKESGFIAGENCREIISQPVPAVNFTHPQCPYCQTVHLDPSGKYRVTGKCESVSNMISAKYFVLPPAMEYYYKMKNPSYSVLPPFRSDCVDCREDNKPLQFIYPENNARLFLPRNVSGQKEKMQAEASIRNRGDEIFWHLDGKYLTTTKTFHKISLSPQPGEHTLLIIDKQGNRSSIKFTILK